MPCGDFDLELTLKIRGNIAVVFKLQLLGPLKRVAIQP
jgi:hypothetical protein